jgi:hypothetical protein
MSHCGIVTSRWLVIAPPTAEGWHRCVELDSDEIGTTRWESADFPWERWERSTSVDADGAWLLTRIA